MRTPVVAGNWKMNTTLAEATALARDVRGGVERLRGATTVVCPPAISIVPVSIALEGSGLFVGAQDVSASPQGAHTGDISADMLAGLCTYVIVGHSERRASRCESDATTAAKAAAALRAGLRVIVCVGESLDVREGGDAIAHVTGQVARSLDGIENLDGVLIAYEPVWAIGTGKAASPAAAQEMAKAIRAGLGELNAGAAETTPILYGGSVNPDNCGPFFAAPDIDGALVGGASLDADAFSRIVKIAARG